MAEVILLGGGLFCVWNLALQRHRKLNSAKKGAFDNPIAVERYKVNVAPHIYHPEQNKINSLPTGFSGRFDALYASRQTRARSAAKIPKMDRQLTHTNGYMGTSRVRLDSEPVTPATHADFSEDGRGRLLKSQAICTNEMLVVQ